MRRSLIAVFLCCFFLLSLTSLGTGPEPAKLPSVKQPDFSNLVPVPVIRTVDGDTIVISLNAEETTVRLIGVDTPETLHPSKPVQQYGKEASLFTNNLLKGEQVYVVTDPQQGLIDRYGRTLAYIYRAPDGFFVNAEIIRQGYGHAYTANPFKYMDEFRQLENFARVASKGLWGSPEPSSVNIRTDIPAANRDPQQLQPATDSHPDDDVIVYITRTGRKYHRASCRYFSENCIPIKLKDAKIRYSPCSICTPPR